MQSDLEQWGFRGDRRWQRGVDTQLFRPQSKQYLDLPRPVAVYVGRLAVEKNIDAFLKMPWTGSKLVVGDGPERARLQASFPMRYLPAIALARSWPRIWPRGMSCCFPSRTDTFGLVNLEAMACGLPVAASSVTRPSMWWRMASPGPWTRTWAAPRSAP